MGYGGDIIWRKILLGVCLLASLSWAGMAGASAADTGTAPAPTVNNSSVQENMDQPLEMDTNQSTTAIPLNQTDESSTQYSPSPVTNNHTVNNSANTIQNTTEQEKAAAGTTETVTTTTFTLSQIKSAATWVKSYIQTNKQLPSSVTIASTKVQMSDFLKLMTSALLEINSGTTAPITLKTVNSAHTPSENIKSGTINKVGYLDIARRVNAFINANGRLPNYVTSSLGKLRPESLIYMFSRVLSFQETNHRLPSYVSATPWAAPTTTTTDMAVPDALKIYLEATTNCQVNNTQIQALATSITSGKTSTYAKAEAIFNWVRDSISYSFYYNTQRGAVGTLNAQTGNCVDTTHLLVALSRAAGIPARYQHGTCKFTSDTYGHVWSQIWVNGKWYTADASSSRNSLGVVNSWTLITLKGTYAALSF